MKFIIIFLFNLNSILHNNMNKNTLDISTSIINKSNFNKSENNIKSISILTKLFNFTEFDQEHLKRMVLLF